MADGDDDCPSVPPPPRRFTGRKKVAKDAACDSSRLSEKRLGVVEGSRGSATRRVGGVPPELLLDPDLNAAIAALPSNYNLELHKTVWRLTSASATRVLLQFPEGLLMYACTISDIIERFVPTVDHCIVLADPTYGACCVEDYKADALGCDFLVHYGHSCLVPVNVTCVPSLYVFVEIQFNVRHFIASFRNYFQDHNVKVALAGTIQFTGGLQEARSELEKEYTYLTVPQSRPLSQGEVLGCTAPRISEEVDAIVFIADGRFHLEAIMIANPTIPAYRYDPYSKDFTREGYDHAGMRMARRAAVERASTAKVFGLVLGTLGRQGSPGVLSHIESRLKAKGCSYTVFLISELSQAKLDEASGIEAWIQIACPRLSIDWGEQYDKPLLSSYEAEVALGFTEPWWVSSDRGDCGCGETNYPMDYYSREGGEWCSSYHKKPKKTVAERAGRKCK